MSVPYAAAYRALFQRARAMAGKCSWARRQRRRRDGRDAVGPGRGLTVIGTAGTDAGRRLAAEQGAHYVLDHHEDGYLQEAMRITENRGVDVSSNCWPTSTWAATWKSWPPAAG